MTTKTQTLPEKAGFILEERDRNASREAITLKSGENLNAGAIITGVDGTVTTSADANNTGNGTFDVTPVGKAGVKAGVYNLLVLESAAAGGQLALFDPDGHLIGRGAVGSAFDNQLAFTLQDGATDFVAGDNFDITVEDPKWIERAAGIEARGALLEDKDASGGDESTTAVVRDAVMNGPELVHATGAQTDAEKKLVARVLKRTGIIVENATG